MPTQQIDYNAQIYGTPTGTGSTSPSGPAGGDLTGTYPNPIVHRVSNSLSLANHIFAYVSGTMDNFNPSGLENATVVTLTGTTGGIITGIVGGYAGRVLVLKVEDDTGITLLAQSLGSLPNNRFDLAASGAYDVHDSIWLIYSEYYQRWTILASHTDSIADSDVLFTDNIINDVDDEAHGYIPKLPPQNGAASGMFFSGAGIYLDAPVTGIRVQDEGIPQGTGTTMNFVGPHVTVSISGSNVRVYVSGSNLFNDAEGDPAAISKTAADGTSVYPARRDHVHTAEATNVTLPVVGTPNFNDVQDMHTIHNSVGVIDGDAVYITKVDENHIDVAAGQGLLRTTNDINGDLKFINWAASSGISIPTGTSTVDVIRYVGVEYNSGSPQVTVRTTFNWNWYTDFPLGRVTQDGTTLRVINVLAHAEDTANWARRFLRVNMPFTREEPPEGTGGLEIGDKATRYLTMSGGNIWHGFNKFVLAAVDTSGTDRFDAHYRNAGGGFTHITSQQQWPNTQYDDGSGVLADLTNNRFGCLWVYVDVSDGSLDVLYGTSNAVGASNAQAEQPPTTIPGHLTAHGRLLGRIIFQKSASTATFVESAWAVSFHAVAGGAVTFNDAEGDPAAVGTTADGTSVYASRRDHVHAQGGTAGGDLSGTYPNPSVVDDSHAHTASTVSPLADGWISAGETWTRTGNHTFTVSGDVTAKYRKGTKVRYKDGGAYEYGVIFSSSYGAPNTTVTLFTNDDYAMAAATITDNYISYIENPEGYPDWFNWTPSYSASGSMTWTSVSTTYAKFRVSGHMVYYEIFATGTTGGTANNTLQATGPCAITQASGAAACQTRDATSGAAVVGTGGQNSSIDIFARKADASNYGLGAGRILLNYGFYDY